MLIEDQERVLKSTLHDNARHLLQIWKQQGYLPAIPQSINGVRMAMSQEISKARREYFISLIREQSPESDGWIRGVVRDFEMLTDMETTLDAAHPYRDRVVKMVASLVENIYPTTILREVLEGLRAKLVEAMERPPYKSLA